MPYKKRIRIIFLDMMRALAVLMMVQGHTIDTFLAGEYRTLESPLFSVWFSIRGFTAPIFMFTSGVVFTFLLFSNNELFFKNPRVKKGIKRIVILVLIGYLLRYPTYTVFDFSGVRHDQWMGFFTVDALHLIGFGLFFILIFAFLSERIKVSSQLIFLLSALFFFLMFSITEKINWANYLPIPLAAYLYHGTGSFFPLFPWVGYVLCGAYLGSYLAHNPAAFTTVKFSKRLFIIGLSFLAFSQIVEFLEDLLYKREEFWTDNIYVITMRLGWVILLNSLMSYAALKLKTIPEFIKQVGRHTLLVYAVHVIILYGSAWTPGLSYIYSMKMDIFSSLISAVIMVIIMALMVMGLERYKLIRKNKFATSEI
jgi:uncharacterized membrane protein